MLVEHGFVVAQCPGGAEYTFTPSFRNVARLGRPAEIVSTYASLHSAKAGREAAYVLATFCDQDDPCALIGWLDGDEWLPGLMPEGEQVLLARHLMEHAIVGKARPSQGGGKYVPEFHVAEYVSAARVHLGLSVEEACELSMTEFQSLFEMKFPEARPKEVASEQEYQAGLEYLQKIRDKALKVSNV